MPIIIIDSQTLRIVTKSEFIILDVQTTSYEFGKFDGSGRLQIILRDGDEHVVYNLPEGWLELKSVREDSHPNPIKFGLNSAFPNPFNSATTITYTLLKSGEIRLSIHDIPGREIIVLQDDIQTARYKKAIWNAGDQPSGLYLCRLESRGKVATAKLTLVK